MNTRKAKKYDLHRALKILLSTESQAARVRTYDRLKSISPSVKLVDHLYHALESSAYKAFLLFAFFLKSYFSVASPRIENNETICAVGFFVNEAKAIGQLAKKLSKEKVEILGCSKLELIHPRNLLRMASLMKYSIVVFRICRLLARRYHIMPAFRAMSLLGFYFATEEILRKSSVKACLVSSNYAPDSLALSATAHKRDCPLIYVNHAQIWARARYLPPVYADLSILCSQANVELYRKKSRIESRIVLKGIEGPESRMRLKGLKRKGEDAVFGIFLTGQTVLSRLEVIIQSLLEKELCHRVLLRPHPISMVNDDYSYLAKRYSQLLISTRHSAARASLSCDCVFCGNSGVALEVLKAGTPVAYDPALDTYGEDFYGYVAKGLLFPVKSIDSSFEDDLAEFYSNADWLDRMKYFDASYLEDKEAIAEKIQRELSSICGDRPTE